MKLIGNHYEKMSIFLCEDNEEHLNRLWDVVKFVGEQKGLEISLTAFRSADEMLEKLESESVLQNISIDVIFADIEMPGMNGIELGKKIHQSYPECYFVFTTAFEEYAIQGYEARAYRYLLKPITEQNISQTLEQILKEKERSKSLMLKEQGKEVFLPLKEIIYISAEDKYTIFHTKEISYFDRISLKECEQLLCNYGFYQIHRSYMVNMKHHKKLGKGMVVLSNDIQLPISRNREEEYRKCFMRQLEKGLLE